MKTTKFIFCHLTIVVISCLPSIVLAGSTAIQLSLLNKSVAPLQEIPLPPSSSVLLQNALTDLNLCVSSAISVAAYMQLTFTTDTLMNQCADEQSKLKQMLPADMYNAGTTNTKQFIEKALTIGAQIQK